MAKTIRSSVNLGPSKVGLTLIVQLKDDAGTNVAATWSVVEVGSAGNYVATSTDVPDSFVGGCVLFTHATDISIQAVDRDGVTISLIALVIGTTPIGQNLIGLVVRPAGVHRVGPDIIVSFTTYNNSLAPAAPTSGPTGTVYKNSTLDAGVVVTISGSAGLYFATLTLPVGYTISDTAHLVLSAVMGGRTFTIPVSLGNLDTKAVAEITGGDFPTEAEIAAEVNTVLSASHGSGSWITATGFETEASAAARAAANQTEHDATQSLISALQTGSPTIEVVLTEQTVEVQETAAATIEVTSEQPTIEVVATTETIEVVEANQTIEVTP